MPEPKSNFSYFALSLTLHASFFLLALFWQKLGPHNIPLLIQPTVKVDLVALPNEVKNPEPPPMDIAKPIAEKPPELPPPEEKSEEETPVAPNKTSPKTHKDAENKAKNAIERMREEMETKKLAEDKKRKELLDKRKADLKKLEETYRSAVRGNQVNQGTSNTGQMEETKNAYGAYIANHLRENWSLPSYLQSKGFRAVVRIYLDQHGTVTKSIFTKYSGNDVFDEYVKSTIQQSSPFSPPPDEFSGKLRTVGMEVNFPL